MAAGKHNAAAVVHGLRAWRLLLLPSIIGERAPAHDAALWNYMLFFSASADRSRSWIVPSASASASVMACALGLSTHWTDCRVAIGTEPRD